MFYITEDEDYLHFYLDARVGYCFLIYGSFEIIGSYLAGHYVDRYNATNDYLLRESMFIGYNLILLFSYFTLYSRSLYMGAILAALVGLIPSSTNAAIQALIA